MAKSDNRKRGEVPEAPRWSNEVVGIILICAGLLAFLAVISYTPKDLPTWGILEAFAEPRAVGEARHNFIGIVGALLGSMVEGELLRTWQLSGGDPTWLLGRPIALALLALLVLSLAWPMVRQRMRKSA